VNTWNVESGIQILDSTAQFAIAIRVIVKPGRERRSRTEEWWNKSINIKGAEMKNVVSAVRTRPEFKVWDL